MLENAEENNIAQTTEADNNNSNRGGSSKPVKLTVRVDKDGKKVVVADNSAGEPEKQQSPLDRLENALKSHENEENGQADQD